MQAPVLTKNQARKAINKNVLKKKSVRNLLSKPKNLAWPCIQNDDSKDLITHLKELLYYKHDVKVKWRRLKSVPREERKAARKVIENNMGKEERPKLLNSIIFGINGVTRGLEKKIITSVIITCEPNPIDMVKHIWHSCTKLHIPVIVIPSLRLILKETIGFPSVIMGFKRVSLDNPLNRIYGIICELSKNFTCESYPYVETITLDDTIVESTEETGDTTPKTKKRDVYLYRTDSTVRCFAPPKSANCNDANSLEWNSDFIEFSEDMDITENISQNTKVDPEIPLIRKAVGKLNRRLANNERKGSSYLPVNIKRLQSNPRRKKI